MNGMGNPNNKRMIKKLESKIRRLGWNVEWLDDDLLSNPSFPGGGFAAICDPTKMTISVSSSLETYVKCQVLAHELGHALQYEDGSYNTMYSKTIYGRIDPIAWFQGELDAVERGRALGVDMDHNYWSNYLGYMDILGLDHLGRS